MNMKQMKRLGAALLVVGAVYATRTLAWAHGGAPHHDENAEKHMKMEKGTGEKVTLTGEVVDIACYMGHDEPAIGKAHQECAKDCLTKRHTPPGLRTSNGTVYLLVEDHDQGFEKAFKMVGELAAEQAKVTGRKVMRGGMAVVLVEKIEKAGGK